MAYYCMVLIHGKNHAEYQYTQIEKNARDVVLYNKATYLST